VYTPTPYFKNIPLGGLLATLAVQLAVLLEYALKGR
jgi:hypothetical protein